MTELTSLLIFLIVGGIGFLFLIFSLIVGDIFEAFDLDLGFDADGGDGHFGVLDSRVISVFLTALGGLGAIGIQFGLGLFISLGMGLLGGLVFGAMVFGFGYLLYSQQSSSSVSERDLIGRTAKVIVGIQPGSIGQISCTVGEEKVEKLARTRDDEKIDAGTMVLIEDVTGDSFIVSKMEDPGFSLFGETD